LAVVLVGLAAAPAEAVYTSASPGGTSATLTGDAAAFDVLTISSSGGLLRHNRFTAGDPGFDSDFDFRSGDPGDQTVSDSGASQLTINAGGGGDLVQLGFNNSVFNAAFTVDGGGDADFLFTPFGTSGADTVTLNGGGIDGLAAGHVAHTTVEQVNLRAGGGNDLLKLDATTTAPTYLFGEGDNDTLQIADGAGLAGGIFRGGPGTDTLDYSAWTTPATVDLGKTAQFIATLNGANQVPPVATAATGDAVVEFTDLATNKFRYEVNINNGLTSADITDSHIHAGAAGVNGGVVFSIGPASGWSDPGTPRTEATDQSDPDITEPLLRAGNTYVNIHTVANGGGEIRGQLTLDPENGYGGTATGTGGVTTVENVIGGSGADNLKGSVVANVLDGRGGADTVEGREGADTLACGDGSDSEISDLTDTLTACETLLGTATVTGVDPASPADNLNPKVKGTATPADLNVRIYGNATCTGTPLASGTAAEFAGSGITVPVADGSLTTFYAAVADTAAQSACSSTSASYQEVAPAPFTPTPTPPGPSTPGPGPGPGNVPVGTLSSIKAKASGRGRRITIDTGASAACPATATAACKVSSGATAKLRSGRKLKTTTLGRGTQNVARGKSSRVKLTLSAAQTTKWRKAGKLKVKLTIQLTVPGGRTLTQTKTVSLKPPARR
jgi:hypothetical protein